jgi:hypothetical protein
MQRLGVSLGVFTVLAVALLIAPGCGDGDTIVHEYYELPGFVRVTTDYLPDVQVNTAYSETIEALGGSGTFTWSIVAGGTNDAWLAIDAAGALTGTPTATGQVILTIRVEDTDDATKFDTERYVFYVTAGSTTPPPSFPGTPVADNNVADDGVAFSPSSVDVDLDGEDGLFLFTNHANGTGIYLAKMCDDFDSPTMWSLWASYFDGTEMSPMVELRGFQQNPNVDYDWGKSRVIFINITGDARDGDAIILFTRTEIDSGTSDVRLYSAYFDVSEADDAVSTSNAAVHYGFDTVADLVNTDNDGFDVDGVGFLTDGIYLMTAEFTSDFSFTLQGQQVSFVGAVWTEGDGTGGEMFSAGFDLTSTNTDNTFSTPQQHNPAFRTMDWNDSFDSHFQVTGDCIVYCVEYIDGSPDDDTVIEAAVYNPVTGGLYSQATLTRDDITDNVYADNKLEVFGAIQGLDRVYVVGRESGYDNGTNNPDTDLMLYIYDPSDGSKEVAEIDYHTTNFLSFPLDVLKMKAELNRTGEVIFIGWIQQHQDAMTGTNSFYMQAVQTIPTGGASRTLANSILAAPETMNSDTTSGTDYANVVDFGIDREVMYLFGNQSDHLRCNTIFIQEPDNGADADNLSLHHAYLKVTLDTTGTAPPAMVAGSGAISDYSIWENDVEFPFWASISMRHFVCMDSGTSGQAVVYFVADGDGSPEDHTGGNAVEPRLMWWDERNAVGNVTEISGDCADTSEYTLGLSNSRQVIYNSSDSAFNVTSMPYALYTGANADVTASYHNIMFIEQRDVPGSTSMLRHRCLDLSLLGAPADQFYPNLNSQPFDVSRDVPEGVVVQLGDGPVPQNNTTFAAYFKQGTHLWYNEYTPGATNTWVLTDGLSDPFLDFMGTEVVTWNMMAIAPFTIGTFDGLAKLPTFYVKALNLIGLGNPVMRVFCRIHD